MKPVDGLDVSGEVTIRHAFTLDGPVTGKHSNRNIDQRSSQQCQIGRIEPLVWFYEYTNKFQHPFLYRHPLNLPPGTVIHGVPTNATIVLIPAAEAKSSK